MTRLLRLGACAALVLLAAPALAADLDGPPIAHGGRPDWAPPPPLAEGGETCRVFVRRRIGPDGEERIRRVRVCEEAAEARPHWHHRPWREEGEPGDRFPSRAPGAAPIPPEEVPERW